MNKFSTKKIADSARTRRCLGERMNYERLTEKEHIQKLKEHYYGDWGKQDKIYLRLAELEDKLESGVLVKLPCKVGDPVWVIDYDEEVVSYICVAGNSSFLFLSPTVYAEKEISTPEELCDYYVDCYMEDGTYADIVIFPCSKCFTDKAQAETRLKELQEGKK